MAQYQPRAQRSDGETFFGLHLYLAERCCKNLQNAKGPAHVNSAPTITWQVGLTSIVSFLNNNPPPPLRFLRDKILLKKN